MKLAKCVELSGLRVKSAVHWVGLMRSINWIKREGNSLTEEGILFPTAFRLRIATSASLQFTRGQLVDLLVFLSQFLKTNHSLCLPAGSVCTSHQVFWRTVTHEHCKACCTVLLMKPNVLGSITGRGQFLISDCIPWGTFTPPALLPLYSISSHHPRHWLKPLPHLTTLFGNWLALAHWEMTNLVQPTCLIGEETEVLKSDTPPILTYQWPNK